MDTWDAVAMVLFLMAGIGLAWMMARPRRVKPDQRALRAWARAERDAEPKVLTQDRLDAWRKEQKAKGLPSVIVCKGEDVPAAMELMKHLSNEASA